MCLTCVRSRSGVVGWLRAQINCPKGRHALHYLYMDSPACLGVSDVLAGGHVTRMSPKQGKGGSRRCQSGGMIASSCSFLRCCSQPVHLLDCSSLSRLSTRL